MGLGGLVPKEGNPLGDGDILKRRAVNGDSVVCQRVTLTNGRDMVPNIGQSH